MSDDMRVRAPVNGAPHGATWEPDDRTSRTYWPVEEPRRHRPAGGRRG